MPDSVTSRTSAATRPPRKTPSGPPLKTKAEKRAEAKAAKARARVLAKRRQTLTVLGAAAVVLALVVGLVYWIGNTSADPATVASSATPTVAATAEPAAEGTASKPFPPVPEGADPALSTKPAATAGKGTVSALKTTTVIEGKGAAVESGQTIEVNYVGVTYADGKEFDSSWSRSEAFSFAIGAGNVIQGWDKGLLGVKVGSRVTLDIPADQAYGESPSGGQPAGALRFVVDVLSAS
ncbi:FKBP-type peptidyl-prolyl cis-trans isomerase [Actinoplanes couchii]|uniref:Peptidyl-prolyl cis-trans isomerase n=1 Tax=Actinoplanes couchii TaxID=403638 RepID=A0ABQ3XKG9_9ACTN|nr:FKBP-type peptidyl-prolyl cis-trans isomerase [Actinoplanes couchii]MDR6320594.1 peptidylprolyl isomerase [Actinoplanes couchii]GID58997.1 hypothetical protein Aco03nite_074010 [Actinoplanes couchii]